MDNNDAKKGRELARPFLYIYGILLDIMLIYAKRNYLVGDYDIQENTDTESSCFNTRFVAFYGIMRFRRWYDKDFVNWVTPAYIKEGLEYLQKD